MRSGNGRTRLLPTDSGFPVALYARVSTTQQDPEVQLRELRTLATARGWTITREYVDAGISGASTSRPELSQLLTDAHKGCFAGILVWRLDRLGRSLRHLVTVVEDPPGPGNRGHLRYGTPHGLYYPNGPPSPQYLRLRGGVRAGDDPGAGDSGTAEGKSQWEARGATQGHRQPIADHSTSERKHELAGDRPEDGTPQEHGTSVSTYAPRLRHSGYDLRRE